MVKAGVRLHPEEHAQLLPLVNTGRAAAVQLRHGRLWRNTEVGASSRSWTDAEIAEALATSAAPGPRVRQACGERGGEAALSRRRPPGRQYRSPDGAQEAQRLAVPWRAPPAGRGRWTRRLLADTLVALAIVDTISTACVRTTLNNRRSTRGSSSTGAFPRRPRPRSSVPWRRCWRSTPAPTLPSDRR